jgi:hypothetical protein
MSARRAGAPVPVNAGAFGYHLHRRLMEMGGTSYMVQPQDLDERGKGINNDWLYALALCQRLDRFTRGNRKAFSIVRVPTQEQERARALSRQRQRLQAVGRSLLASHGIHGIHGIHDTGRWWRGRTYSQLRASGKVSISCHAQWFLRVYGQGGGGSPLFAIVHLRPQQKTTSFADWALAQLYGEYGRHPVAR